MVRNQQTKATWEEHTALAQWLYEQNYPETNVVPWLKSIKYSYEGNHYNAVTVSAMLTGMYAHSATAPAEQSAKLTAGDLIMVEQAFAKGELKYTKKLGLHNPKDVA